MDLNKNDYVQVEIGKSLKMHNWEIDKLISNNREEFWIIKKNTSKNATNTFSGFMVILLAQCLLLISVTYNFLNHPVDFQSLVAEAVYPGCDTRGSKTSILGHNILQLASVWNPFCILDSKNCQSLIGHSAAATVLDQVLDPLL